MRLSVIAAALSLAGLASLFDVPPSRAADFYTAHDVLKWINGYRAHPEPARVPAALHKLSDLGELRDFSSSGIYLGFVAGVLASNPAQAEGLVTRMLPLPPEDQWFLVRAIAYSGLPQWRTLLTQAGPRLTTRAPMVQKYLDGALPVLAQYRLEKPELPFFQRVGAYLSFGKKKEREKEVVLEPSAELLDTFWGYYYATGQQPTVQRIIALLPWSTDRDNVDKLTLGGMAKYTLAMNAARDPDLLALLKGLQPSEPEAMRKVLHDVIEAADDADITRVKREALASLDELRRKGSGSRRAMSLWGQIGEGALSAGCVVAAVTGQAELGVPCVVGGALTSGALHYISAAD